MLEDPACHAVERHGPQIPDKAQLARLIWLKDPSGTDVWLVAPDGSVQSNHRCGTSAGGFTSPDALAKPIEAFLRVAHARADGVDEFLARNAHGANSLGVHVSAGHARLSAGDARAYRGAGTGTRESRRDWIAARRLAMRRGEGPVHAVPYDPIAEGTDPGVTLVFKRTGASWRLVTCYPVEKPGSTNKRLEDLA